MFESICHMGGGSHSLSCSQWLSPNASCIQTFGVRFIAYSPKIGPLNLAGIGGESLGLLRPVALSQCQLYSNLRC